MTYQIDNADVREWAERYDGPPFHAAFMDAPLGRSLCPLYLSIGLAMTGVAEGDKVRKIVRLFIPLDTKEAKRLDVMNCGACSPTVLAGVVVAPKGFAPLRLPVRAAPLLSATRQVLRMVEAVAVCIAALARTIFAAALALLQPTCVYRK